MADFDHNSTNVSTPLNTTLETNPSDLAAEHTASTDASTSNHTENQTDTQTHEAATHEATHAPASAEIHGTGDIHPAAEVAVAESQVASSISASADNAAEPEYDAEDFAKALASFDLEQAAEKDAAQSLTAEEVIVTGTVVKITDKHVVVDIGLKSEGLIPLDQVVDHTGAPKFAVGDTVEVVVEREEKEGGYLVSHEKALRHKVWDTLEEACNSKTPVKGMVLSRVKGGLTVDIGIKAFLPGSQVEVRPVRNLDGYIGTEIEVRVIKLNKKRGECCYLP